MPSSRPFHHELERPNLAARSDQLQSKRARPLEQQSFAITASDFRVIFAHEHIPFSLNGKVNENVSSSRLRGCDEPNITSSPNSTSGHTNADWDKFLSMLQFRFFSAQARLSYFSVLYCKTNCLQLTLIRHRIFKWYVVRGLKAQSCRSRSNQGAAVMLFIINAFEIA